MSKLVEKRNYHTQYFDEFAATKKNLIRMPQMSLRKGAAPMSFAKGSRPDAGTCFLTETDRVRAGHVYSVFEVNRVYLDEKTHRLEVDADISFPESCEEISLYADLLDMERDQVLASFEQETVKDSNRLVYQIDESFDGLPEGELGVILCASWKAAGDDPQKAAVIRQIGSDVTYGIDFTYPKKEEKYIKFTNDGRSVSKLPPEIPGLFLQTEKENIQIALFREPQDGRDLDYLCEFGKNREGQPYFGVPTLFTVWLDSATTSFSMDKPVNVTLAIASLDPAVGGRYVVAAGSDWTTSEGLTVKAKKKEIEVEFVGPWKVPFPYGGNVRPYDFSYEVILELYT